MAPIPITGDRLPLTVMHKQHNKAAKNIGHH